ncbi:WD40 repeat domain-containing protein, partial [Streptomyces clavuligerus]
MSGPGSGPGPGPAPGPGPGGRPEGGAGAWDAPDEAHRLIAKALADLVAEDPAVPPHPYLSRHLAAHAARGEVLDDDHVPPALLPWETSRNVRALLRRTGPGNQREWLKAWARIEPFVRDADPESRLTSLHLAHHTATRPRTPFTAPAAAPTAAAGGAPAAGSRVTPLWSDWTAPDNVLAVCGAPVESLTHLTSSPGRTLLVSGDREGTIRRWETHGGTFGAPLRAHGGAVQHLLPLGGELLVSGGADGAVRVWNAVRGQLLTEAAHRPRTWVSGLTLFAPPPPHPPLCLLVAHSDGRLMALDTVAFRPVDLSLPELDEAPAIVVGVGGATGADSADSADSAMRGDMCLVVAQGQGVGRWRPGEDAVTRIAEHRDEVRAAVALSPDAGGDGRFATCDESGAIRFWDAASGRETAAADPSPGVPVTALAALRVDGRPAVVSAGVDHTLRLWDAGTGRPIGAPFEGHTASPVALTALPDEARHLVSAGMDGTLRRWRAAGHGSRPARPARRPVTAAALPGPEVPAGPGLPVAVADADTAGVWNAETGRSLALPADGTTVTAFAWTTVGGEPLLLSAHSDAGLRLWSIGGDGAVAHRGELVRHSLPVRAMVAFRERGPTGRELLATGGADGSVCLWDLVERRLLSASDRHMLSVRGLTVLDTGAREGDGGGGGPFVVSAGADGTLRLWDTAGDSADLLARPPVHCGQRGVHAVAAVATGDGGAPLVASGGEDGTVRLWDSATLSPVGAPLDAADGPVTALASFRTPSGHPCLAAAGPGGTVHLWDVPGRTRLLRLVTGAPLNTLAVRE